MENTGYDLNHHLTYRIARLHARLNAQATGLLKSHIQVSLSEWRILSILYNTDVETQKDVLEAMGLDKGQISRTLKRLEHNCLIRLSIVENDHRQRQIDLTEKGRELIQKMLPVMAKRQAHLQSGMELEEIEMLFSLISKLEQKAHYLELAPSCEDTS